MVCESDYKEYMTFIAGIIIGAIGMLALQLLLIIIIHKGYKDVLFDADDNFLSKADVDCQEMEWDRKNHKFNAQSDDHIVNK